MNSISPEKYSDILKFLHELLHDKSPNYDNVSLDKINEDLRKENINVSSVIVDVRHMIAKKKANKKLNAAKAKRTALSQLAAMKNSFPQNGVREKLISIFENLNSSQPQLASAYFRKLEEVSEEDMLSMLEDLLLLDQEDDPE